MSEETKVTKVYGIDLGTTYSAIACINEDGKPEIIKNMEGDSTTPSVVLFEPGSDPAKPNFTVGKAAKSAGATMANNVVAFIKRLMGKETWVEIEGLKLNPQKVSSYILRKLVEDAKLAGEEVKDVVITCPAYFDDAKRRATREAGEIAGLNVLQIVDEPVAAAMHYGLNKVEGNRTAIVYDLGGGTFDVTVVKISKEDGVKVEVLCSDGNHELGGKNWDDRIVELLAQKFSDATGVDKAEMLSDPDTRFDLQTAAEIVKFGLTSRPKVPQKITYGGNSERIEITREEFENATRDLLEDTATKTEAMFEMAKERGVDHINDFLLVGGSTRMPQVQALVNERFASRVDGTPKPFEQDEAVAKGAAMFAHVKAVQTYLDNAQHDIIDAEVKGRGGVVSPDELNEIKESAKKQAIEQASGEFSMPVKDVEIAGATITWTVASRSYGVRLLDKQRQPVVYNMIKKQDPMPATSEREFPVSDSNAMKLPIDVYANNIVDTVAQIAQSEQIGHAEMLLPPNTPKGAMIRVSFSLSPDGVLEISAADVATGTKVEARIEKEYGMSQEEIEQARVENASLEMV